MKNSRKLAFGKARLFDEIINRIIINFFKMF